MFVSAPRCVQDGLQTGRVNGRNGCQVDADDGVDEFEADQQARKPIGGGPVNMFGKAKLGLVPGHCEIDCVHGCVLVAAVRWSSLAYLDMSFRPGDAAVWFWWCGPLGEDAGEHQVSGDVVQRAVLILTDLLEQVAGLPLCEAIMLHDDADGSAQIAAVA